MNKRFDKRFFINNLNRFDYAYTGWNNHTDINALESEFSIVVQNNHFLLLKRVKFDGKYQQERETFIKLFGKGSIGLSE